ncbi:Glutamate decarboxylase 1 [Raphanus sativus]|nr:Glutamate decarboxylase 1 [Raphanus sativus]
MAETSVKPKANPSINPTLSPELVFNHSWSSKSRTCFTVLRVVIREDFSRTLAERLVIDIEKVMRELDELPSRVIHKISLGEAKSKADGDNLIVTVKKIDMEKKREIINGWKKFVYDRKKTYGIC